jgi:hypothetical protein
MADKKEPRKRSFDERENGGQFRQLKDTVESSADAAKGDSIMFGDGAEGILRLQRRLEEVDKEMSRLRRVKVQLLKALACHDLEAEKPKGFQPSKEVVVEGRARLKAAKEAEAEILGHEPRDDDLDDSAEVNALLDELDKDNTSHDIYPPLPLGPGDEVDK